MTVKVAEVRRLLDRYLVEIVETYDLCPWARGARLGGEVSVEVLFGQPSLEAWISAVTRALARPATRVAMIVAPELAATPSEFRDIRSRVTSGMTGVGIAEFHPDCDRDPVSPARLVPYLRRSPDPLLQAVPLALLDSVRASQSSSADRMDQAEMLVGLAPPPRADVADRIAMTNHMRVLADAAAFEARLTELAIDRRQSYARVGITINTSR